MHTIAVAIIHADPPDVLMATDLGTLEAVLGLELIARLDPSRLGVSTTERLRDLLLAEQWADALTTYMEVTDEVVDVYPEYDVTDPGDVARDLLGHELQLRPLFRSE